MSIIEDYILWVSPIPNNPPVNEMVATEELPDTSACSVAYNLNSAGAGQTSAAYRSPARKAVYYVITGLGLLLRTCLAGPLPREGATAMLRAA